MEKDSNPLDLPRPLLSHDIIQTSEGHIVPYQPIYDGFNVEVRDRNIDEEVPEVRMDTLKEVEFTAAGWGEDTGSEINVIEQSKDPILRCRPLSDMASDKTNERRTNVRNTGCLERIRESYSEVIQNMENGEEISPDWIEEYRAELGQDNRQDAKMECRKVDDGNHERVSIPPANVSIDIINTNGLSLGTQSVPSEDSLPGNSNHPVSPKRYDVFFSHAYEDRDWVIDVMRKLESAPYHMTCCFDERDFEAGLAIFENITRSIKASKKTVIVLSPEFLKSSFCDYEIRMTHEMNVVQRRRLMIPVMLRPCRLPDFLGRLTYIDVQNEHFWWDRFVSDLQKDDAIPEDSYCRTEDTATYRSPTALRHPFHHNCDKLAEISIFDKCNRCSSINPSVIPSELTSSGSRMTNEDFQLIIETLQKDCYVSCHCCFAMTANKIILLNFIMFAISGLICILGSGFEAVMKTTIFKVTISSLAACVFLLLLRIISGVYFTKRFLHTLVAVNEIARRSSMIIGYKSYGMFAVPYDKLTVKFYFYDWRLCESYLQESANTGDMLDPSQNFATIEDDENQPLLDSTHHRNSNISDLILSHIPEYVELVGENKLLKAIEQRHTQQGECLCQFVENVESDPDNRGRLKCVFGAKSRHPFKRLFNIF